MLQCALLLAIFAFSNFSFNPQVAEHIARQGRRRNFAVSVQDMDSYDRTSLPEESVVIFIACTTGEGGSEFVFFSNSQVDDERAGDVPDNMKKFWTFMLRKDLPANSLQNLRYGVFGLGDSSYTKFNAVARRLNARLKQLGGQEILQRGLGDDQSENGYLTDLDPWLVNLWQEVLWACSVCFLVFVFLFSCFLVFVLFVVVRFITSCKRK